MLAEALDAEELDSYREYLLAGGERKKWKWASSDKAGTSPSKNKPNEVEQGLRNIASTLFGISDLETHKQRTSRPGRAKEFAEITGRPWIFMNPDGVYFDKEVKVINPPFEPGTLIIKIDYEGNEI